MRHLWLVFFQKDETVAVTRTIVVAQHFRAGFDVSRLHKFEFTRLFFKRQAPMTQVLDLNVIQFVGIDALAYAFMSLVIGQNAIGYGLHGSVAVNDTAEQAHGDDGYGGDAGSGQPRTSPCNATVVVETPHD